jgi:anti-anti-sigma factor
MSPSETNFYPDLRDIGSMSEVGHTCTRKITFSCTRAHPVVVRVDGDLDAETVALLRDYLDHLLRGTQALIVDLVKVDFAPASCLQLLIEFAEMAAAEDRWFAVACGRPVSRPLELLGDLVECFDSLCAARNATPVQQALPLRSDFH